MKNEYSTQRYFRRREDITATMQITCLYILTSGNPASEICFVAEAFSACQGRPLRKRLALIVKFCKVFWQFCKYYFKLREFTKIFLKLMSYLNYSH